MCSLYIQRIINLVTGLLATHDFDPFTVHRFPTKCTYTGRALKFRGRVYKLIYGRAANTRGCICSLVFNVASLFSYEISGLDSSEASWNPPSAPDR
jgi:hypothetical protein